METISIFDRGGRVGERARDTVIAEGDEGGERKLAGCGVSERVPKEGVNGGKPLS